jgi:hypothetical protein
MDRIIALGEGVDPKTGSDYDFHKETVSSDDPVSRLQYILKHGTVDDEAKERIVKRFRDMYPQVDTWLKGMGK